MKHVQLRNSIYYYRRRIPTTLSEYTSNKYINRPLSTDKKHSRILSKKYDDLFLMIQLSLKLNEDINKYILELNLNSINKNIFQEYISRLEVSPERLIKVGKLLDVVKHFLPKDLSRIDLSWSDKMRLGITELPNRRLTQYKHLSIEEIISLDIPLEDRLGVGAVNEHITLMNSFLKYLHQREITSREYNMKLVQKTTHDRDEQIALSPEAITTLLEGTVKPKVKDSLTLLYLSGMRPKEAYTCTITTIDGIKCFDLRDTSIKQKTKGSYRLIPVHSSIDNPEQMLEDYRSVKNRVVSRGFKEGSKVGTLYSLRHSFATNLAGAKVEPYMISELLGHSHGGMTMGRYVKGLPMKMLLEVVNKLSPSLE